MMHKTIRWIYVLSLLFLSGTASAFSEAEAKKVAEKFYGNMNKMLEAANRYHGQADEVITYQNSLHDLCYDKKINLPNEIGKLNLDVSLTDFPFLQASTYIGKLSEKAASIKMSFKYEIESVQALEEAKVRKNEDSKNFYDVFVTKTLLIGGVEKGTYHDVVRVHAQSSKITEITNESGGGKGEFLVDFKGRAAKLYAQKRYDESYDEYLKALSKDPKDGDVNYRLGVMTYSGKGCKHKFYSGRARERKAKEYILKAIQEGDYIISDNAKKAKYYFWDGRI